MQLAVEQQSDVVPRPAGRARSRTGVALVAATVVVAAAVFWLVHDALLDDSYITLSYAKRLALHGEWGLVPGEFANSATSPLNVVLLAAGTTVLRSPVLALGVLFVGCAVLSVLALRRAAADSGLPRWIAPLGTASIVLNPLVLSTVGLEMTLAGALLAVLLACATGNRPVLLGVVGALLALTRLDLALFVLVVLAGQPAVWRSWWKWSLSGLLTVAPWLVFSWYAFGSAIPDTLVIKQVQKAWGELGFHNGYEWYVTNMTTATLLAAVPAVVGAVCLVLLCLLRGRGRTVRLWPWALLGFGGIAHYAAYSAMEVPPYHWYYAPVLIGAVFPVCACIGALARQPRMLLPAAVAALALVLPQSWFALNQGVPWQVAPVSTNWATAQEYARIGAEVGRTVGDATVAGHGEIGAMAYFCECRVMDGFSDRGYIGPELEQRIEEAGPTMAALLRFNYRHFEPADPEPVDYVLRREQGPGPDPFWTITAPLGEQTHLVLEPAQG
ncbi:hypothetical protein IQ251_15480 [Saccharopolyspora sp. HNM0983]|uniref:4-amino-4-deoxy-L-arabinose transferase-like glycosyltransferase n=1 Tax=Saccharopolyspora montiporae TaxID=2781240 RepID=A0A929BE61_9PSEU|nr:hypothetical protein [Saccharopolyspora sp. HNM0983]MBE9375852.1 hypothetical protein [Saccharopolyspora sp. HNM0983]